MGLLLIILIVPAFLFIFFQLSFKNYYKLPYIGEGKPQPVKINNTLYQIPQEKVFWVVAYGESAENSEKLFNTLMPLAQNNDMKTLLKNKLPNYQIKYVLFSKNNLKIDKNIILDSLSDKAKNMGLDTYNNVLLIDNKGFVRGKYQVLSQNKEEKERLYTELKVLMEIVASEGEIKNK